jgi:hypothetical protein
VSLTAISILASDLATLTINLDTFINLFFGAVQNCAPEFKKEQIKRETEKYKKTEERKEIKINDRVFFVLIFFVLYDTSNIRHSLHPSGRVGDVECLEADDSCLYCRILYRRTIISTAIYYGNIVYFYDCPQPSHSITYK